VATTGLENTMRAEAGFSPSLNFRVFQQYRRIADAADRFLGRLN
jgi:hypothetical protein